MRNLYLKNNKDITPVVFSFPQLANKKVVNITANLGIAGNTDKLMPYTGSDVVFFYNCILFKSRSLTRFSTFPGGIVVDWNIVCLLVTIQETKGFVILEEEFVETYPTASNQLKRNLREAKILTRNNLVISKREEIKSNFVIELQPSIEDFMIETQIEKSSKFIQKVKENLITV